MVRLQMVIASRDPFLNIMQAKPKMPKPLTSDEQSSDPPEVKSPQQDKAQADAIQGKIEATEAVYATV